VPQPRNHRSFGTLFHRDSLGPGDGAAADWSGMVGDRKSQSVSEVSMDGMEGKELHHRSVEVIDVLCLDFVSASVI
jgi:hypothetical protein